LTFNCLFNYYPVVSRSRPSPRPRGPGRPSAESGDLRQRLLDAALQRFVANGIGATSLREVAKAAGVTPALVHSYFGSKEPLLQAVLAERLQPVLAELMQSVATPSPQPLVQRFVHGVHRVVERHPWLPALWVREILSEGGALREFMLTQVAPQLPRQLAVHVAEQQAGGALNRDLDPRLTVVSLIGLTLFPLAARSLWTRIFAADDIDNAALQRHTLALLSRGLELRDER
jgi:AcrR family transcriptional regulator